MTSLLSCDNISSYFDCFTGSNFGSDVKVVISNLSELLLAYSSIGFSNIGFDFTSVSLIFLFFFLL